MSSEKYIVLAILATAATVALAKPSGIALSIVKDKTICKTLVDYDEDENRIPRVIKVLKCAPNPDLACIARNPAGEKKPCCGQTSLDGPKLVCTEVLDTVLVSDHKNGNYTLNVPIGCSCIQEDSNEAREVF